VPAGAHVLEEGANRFRVLLRAGHQRQQNLASVGADAPGGEHRFAPLARRQPLGDAVDEQIDDVMLGKITLAKGLILRPQPFRDLAHRRPRQQSLGRLVGERVLDVARRQSPRVKFDRQPLQLLRAPRKRRAQPRDEGLARLANLRRRIVHRPFRRLHLAGPITVAIAALLAVAARVTLAPQNVGDLAFEASSTISRSARRTKSLRPAGARPQFSIHQGAKLLARARRCG